MVVIVFYARAGKRNSDLVSLAFVSCHTLDKLLSQFV